MIDRFDTIESNGYFSINDWIDVQYVIFRKVCQCFRRPLKPSFVLCNNIKDDIAVNQDLHTLFPRQRHDFIRAHSCLSFTPDSIHNVSTPTGFFLGFF